MKSKYIAILATIAIGLFSFNSVYGEDLDPEEYNPITDINYDENTNILTFSWDFGENEDRVFCGSRINTVNLVEGEKIEYFALGLELDRPRELAVAIPEIVNNQEESEISCSGSASLDLNDVVDTDYDHQIYIGFVEKIENKGGNPLAELQMIVQLDSDNMKEGLKQDKSCDNQADFDKIYTLYFGKESLAYIIHTSDCENSNMRIADVIFNHDRATSSVDSSDEKNGGGGCSGDCTYPTNGKDRYGTIQVEKGFGLDDNIVDVTGYHTEFPLITLNVGEEYTLQTTIYENSGKMRWVQYGFRSFRNR